MFAVYCGQVPLDEARPPIWWRSGRGTRGPDPALDLQAIADAAVALADSGGLAAVSMRAVAARLGTSASALYRYIDTRADLLDLMADRVVAELRPYPPVEAPWLKSMVALAAAQRSLHQRHPWLVALGYRSSSIGPESHAYFDACLGVLRPTQAPVRTKFETIALLTGLAALFSRQTREDEPDGGATFPALPHDAFPHLAEAMAHPSTAPLQDDLFERAVRSILTGLLADVDQATGNEGGNPAR
jgi:AcrR family transcriptional regulator